LGGGEKGRRVAKGRAISAGLYSAFQKDGEKGRGERAEKESLKEMLSPH